jgi:hypothetical protein
MENGFRLRKSRILYGPLNGDGKSNRRSNQRDNQLKFIHYLKKRCAVACTNCQNIHEKHFNNIIYHISQSHIVLGRL